MPEMREHVPGVYLHAQLLHEQLQRLRVSNTMMSRERPLMPRRLGSFEL